MNHPTFPTRRLPQKARRSGLALMICLFVILLTSLVLVGISESLVSRQASYRNTNAYEKSLYLAGAAVHHGMAELEADVTWRGSHVNIELPSGSGDTYTISAADGASNTIIITAQGTSGTITRNLEVTIDNNG